MHAHHAWPRDTQAFSVRFFRYDQPCQPHVLSRLRRALGMDFRHFRWNSALSKRWKPDRKAMPYAVVDQVVLTDHGRAVD